MMNDSMAGETRNSAELHASRNMMPTSSRGGDKSTERHGRHKQEEVVERAFRIYVRRGQRLGMSHQK